MTKSSIVSILLLGTLYPPIHAQDKPVTPPPPRASLYLPSIPLDFSALLPPPPSPGTLAEKADLQAVHDAETSRTPQQIAHAKQDDQIENIFLFANLLGTHFTPAELPLTAALSDHLRAESGVVNPSTKIAFHRPRPGIADSTLHPVCIASKSDSYPSGHAMVGYLEAFALAQMLPERTEAIFTRARAYAQNRIVCGVHYPTDVEASRTVALALFGALSTSTRFRGELASAKAELRAKLTQIP